MKQFILLITALALQVASYAQNAKAATLPVTDVTVFMSGAQVTHSDIVSLKAGENQIRITDLTANLDPNSIQVEGNSNYLIISVRHQLDYTLQPTSNPKAKQILDSLDDLRFKQKELSGLKGVYERERALLNENMNIKGQNAALLVDDLEEMANFYRERFKVIQYKMLELEDQEADNNQLISSLQQRLNQMNARKNSNPSEVLITLQATKEGKFPLKVSYLAYQAGWIPMYDLRAEDINSNIDFQYRARVFQSTGNDWNDVNLTISTGNPTVGGQAPTLYPWYVNIYDPNMNYRPLEKPASRGVNQTPSVAYEEQLDDMKQISVQGKSSSIANYTTVQNNTVSTEFKIAVPYDIPSDNQQYDVIMQKESIKALFDYVAVPKLDNDAFLRARLTDWMQYSLLPGESNIYFKGTFVGKGFIDPAQANDTLVVSLGRDRSIQIKRDQIKEFCKTSTFGSKQKTTKAYEISITNTKKQAIDIVIEDQLPISQNGDLEIETEELSGASYDATTGKITWKLRIEPGQNVKKQLRFNAKYPKKKYISGL